MAKFKVGDEVEVIACKRKHRHVTINCAGIRFKIDHVFGLTSTRSRPVQLYRGTITHLPPGLPEGCTCTWQKEETLKLYDDKSENSEKYVSPFTGKKT